MDRNGGANMKFLKQLLCDHDYGMLGKWDCTCKNGSETWNVPIYFLECKKCGKNKVVRDSDVFYNTHTLVMVELWLKGQIKIDFTEEGFAKVRSYDEDY